MATAFWDKTSQRPKASFWASGHTPTLIAAFLYFDLAFMVWVMLGPLAPDISRALGLSPAEKGLMVAVPTLAGAVLRVVNGLLVDRIGPKRAGAISQLIVIGGLFSAWTLGVDSFAGTLVLGVILGFAGASFAIALPLASRWYPPEHQGKAMGLAGMGNSGTVLAALFAPTLAKLFGWNAVLGLACIPLGVVFVAFMLMAKDPPNAPAPKNLIEYLEPLKTADAWWLMGFYSVTFGGFVGLAASLPIYFTDRFGLTPVQAGYLTAACVLAGSLVRPMGGALADKIGGVKTLTGVFIVAALALTGVASAATVTAALGLFVIAMLALGTGNGAVFQLVPQRFSAEIGVMTGLVGMAGGVGGFYLASSLGIAKQYTGSFASGFLIFAALAVVALLGLTLVKGRWRSAWDAAATVRIEPRAADPHRSDRRARGGNPAAAQTIALKPLIDARLRYEHVEQDGLALEADAATARVRAGVEASGGSWAALVEGQGTLAIVDDYYDGLRGAATRPLVADPENVALYRAQLQYRSKPLTLTAGRQRIALDDERFVGAVNFRQNGQTFDAVRAEVNAVPKLKLDATYAWSHRTLWGVEGRGPRQQAVSGDFMFANAGYASPIGTLSAFAYLVDEDEAAVFGFRMASQTYGARLAGSRPIGKARLAYQLSYARQSDHHRNPNEYEAGYYLADALLDVSGFKFGAGYEVLGAGHGALGGVALTSFQTPLATGFKFQGWADKFLTTPPDGVRDLYGSLGYGWKTLGPLAAVTLQAAYHRFESDRAVRHYGNEIDLLASAKFRRTTLSLRYADYDADAFATDTQKFWLQMDWTI